MGTLVRRILYLLAVFAVFMGITTQAFADESIDVAVLDEAAEQTLTFEGAPVFSAQGTIPDITLCPLKGSGGTLLSSYSSKNYIIIGGRPNDLGTDEAVEACLSMSADAGYKNISFLFFDLDNNRTTFSQAFSSTDNGQVRFFSPTSTSIDYKAWLWSVYHSNGGTSNTITLPFIFMVKSNGTVAETWTGIHSDFTQRVTSLYGVTPQGNVSLSPNVATRSPAQITSYLKTHSARSQDALTYATTPVKNTQVGAISSASEASALEMLNNIRYVAGLNTVSIKDTYRDEAQAAAFVNYSTNILTHYPALATSRPATMSQANWVLGCLGAGHSNISCGFGNLNSALLDGWMHDGDQSNIADMGHRRWCLNPKMAYTGFGAASYYQAMYSIDQSGSGGQTKVVWPAQTMPIEWFGPAYPWTIMTGTTIDQPEKVTVTLTRLNDNKTWTFKNAGSYSEPSDQYKAYFNIDNQRYASPGCITFRPEHLEYDAGDKFHVKASNVNGYDIEYDVTFIKAYPTECLFSDVTNSTPHYSEILWTYNNGISKGWTTNSTKTFKPYEDVARSDMAAFLFRVAKAKGAVTDSWQPTVQQTKAFSDVTSSTPHAREIWWLASRGISTGWKNADGSQSFKPYASVARQDMAAFLFRLGEVCRVGGANSSWKASSNSQMMFSDVSATASDNHHREIWWLAEKGISTGWKVGGKHEFRGLQTVTRCDMAAFLARFAELF